MDDTMNMLAEPAGGELLGRIGQLTRQLREGLRELGLDKQVALATEAIPDARDRLGYVAVMTERAAQRALNAIDAAQPVRRELAASASALQRRWDAWAADAAAGAADAPVADTRAWLAQVPRAAAGINTQLLEIMMAQDFQDLTGQVIRKMVEVIDELESQLLKVLVDHAPSGARADAPGSLQNGPQIRPDNPSAVAGQAQVDELLQSLGF